MFTETVRQVLGSRFVAALTTPYGVDRYLEQVDPTWSLTEVRARVAAVRRETSDAVTLVLRPNVNWRGFRAGQHVALTVEVGGVRHTRVFSLSSSPRRPGGEIEITIKRHARGLVSQWAVAQARAGAIVTLSQATGDFVLPARVPPRVLLLSGGSGITPCLSILRTLLADGHAGRVTFVHYARTADDVIAAGELARLARRHPALDLRIELTHTATPAPLLDRDRLLALVPDVAACEAYVCGPPTLAAAATAAWTALGLGDRLHLEHFAPPAPPAPPASDLAPAALIRFGRSDRTIASDGRPLLVQAEAAGLSPASGCRMGICGTCRCRKVAGTVRDLRTGQLSGAPDETISLCVSAPVGDVTLDL
ncbi:MAG TPA: ferredoxin reductase [Kofleriaceae bacterium]|nr:ferredoxin reductase [Kofleriaceae bacterium]